MLSYDDPVLDLFWKMTVIILTSRWLSVPISSFLDDVRRGDQPGRARATSPLIVAQWLGVLANLVSPPQQIVPGRCVAEGCAAS